MKISPNKAGLFEASFSDPSFIFKKNLFNTNISL